MWTTLRRAAVGVMCRLYGLPILVVNTALRLIWFVFISIYSCITRFIAASTLGSHIICLKTFLVRRVRKALCEANGIGWDTYLWPFKHFCGAM